MKVKVINERSKFFQQFGRIVQASDIEIGLEFESHPREIYFFSYSDIYLG